MTDTPTDTEETGAIAPAAPIAPIAPAAPAPAAAPAIAAPAAEETDTVLEMPTQGGSYIRHEDGSLERVEFTEHAAPAADEQAEG